MKTMKKFWKYFLNFIVLVLIVSGLTYLGTRNINKNVDIVNATTITNKAKKIDA